MTLNSVIKRIRELCLAHRQIRSFMVGRVTDFLTDKTTKYPAVFVQDNGGVISTEGHAAMLNYRIFFVDLVNASEDTKENELDVQSDMVTVAMDIIAQMNFSIFSDWRLSSENNLQLSQKKTMICAPDVMSIVRSGSCSRRMFARRLQQWYCKRVHWGHNHPGLPWNLTPELIHPPCIILQMYHRLRLYDVNG
jgi:hypothetical protein